MSLNYTEIDKIIEETDLEGSFFQTIKPHTYNSFILGFYKESKKSILISLDNNFRLHLISKKVETLKKPHSFCEYLKRNLIGARVISILQPDCNRVVEIKLLKDSREYNLIIRLWGGYSNFIITDNNYTILHLHRNYPKKGEITGNTFNYPDSKSPKAEKKLKEYSGDSYNHFIEELYNREIEESEKKLREKIKLKEIAHREREIKSLIRKREKYKGDLKLKNVADLLTSNIYQLKPGLTTITLWNYLSEKSETIKLDPKLKPSEQPKPYYKRFKKAESGLERIDNQIERVQREINRIKEGEELPAQKINREREYKNNPGLHYTFHGWEFLVGRNGKENDYLLRHLVKGNDIWLHIRDYPGGYVFIKAKKGRTVPLEVLIYGGNLALFYSKGKNNLKGDIYYTQVKYLRRVKKGKPGQVIPTRSKNLFIKQDRELLKN